MSYDKSDEETLRSLIRYWGDGFVAAFLLYACVVVIVVLVLIFHYVPQYGHSHVMVYVAICSLMGSLSVRSQLSVFMCLLHGFPYESDPNLFLGSMPSFPCTVFGSLLP